MQIWINFGLKLLKIVEELRIVKPCQVKESIVS